MAERRRPAEHAPQTVDPADVERRHFKAAAAGEGRTKSPRAEPYASYDLTQVDQWAPAPLGDIVPADSEARATSTRALAADATVYGYASALQYSQLYEQAVDPSSPVYTGFGEFLHVRDLADPTFTAFRTPNVDTLYSNAWLDLTDGPAIVSFPAFGDRYYTLNFLDMYSNATNISLRTYGGEAGTFLIVPPTWPSARHDADHGHRVFRVATPYVWLLLRILVENDTADIPVVRRLQDEVKIESTAPTGRGDFVPVTSTSVTTDPMSFFAVLDWTLRNNGHPIEEEGLVDRYRNLEVGDLEPFDPAALDAERKAGMEQGFADAKQIISTSVGQLGTPVGGTGFVKILPGAYGFNYLRRAATNLVGTGGNVAEEQAPFTTFVDANGQQLDGATTKYTWHFDSPPPTKHWSVTLYELGSGQPCANEINRYTIADGTLGVERRADGSLAIPIQHERPADTSNWLPAPAGPFYVTVRNWQPSPELLTGAWIPEPIRPV